MLSARCPTCLVRCCMSVATGMKWKAVGVDLTQGFIQAELPKDGKPIYISPPPGHNEEPGVVYQVLKPLYGMPHSGMCERRVSRSAAKSASTHPHRLLSSLPSIFPSFVRP